MPVSCWQPDARAIGGRYRALDARPLAALERLRQEGRRAPAPVRSAGDRRVPNTAAISKSRRCATSASASVGAAGASRGAGARVPARRPSHAAPTSVMTSSASAMRALLALDEGGVDQVAHRADQRLVVRQRRNDGAVAGLPHGDAAGNQAGRRRSAAACSALPPGLGRAGRAADAPARPAPAPSHGRRRLRARRSRPHAPPAGSRSPAPRSAAACWASSPSACAGSPGCTTRPAESPARPRSSRPSCRSAGCAGGRSTDAARPPCPAAPRRPRPGSRSRPRARRASAARPARPCRRGGSGSGRSRSLAVRSSWHEIGDQRAPQPPCHVLDEAGLAAAGRPFEHHRQTARVAMLEDRDFVARGQVVRFRAVGGMGQRGVDGPQTPRDAGVSQRRRRVCGSRLRRRLLVAHLEARRVAEEVEDEQAHADREDRRRSTISITKCTWIFSCASR